ncbi:alpha/beta fold hydrolase [Halobium salinum]|uniref:Alpha/beta fold hydrolase n=1 Tax=Halobium salinum TaxID=1364940 RepID=A0ABD5PH35_9EURY|nr:alpha/beta fold hydrolase [Halobium salinum]
MTRPWARRNGERLAVWALVLVLVLASVGTVYVQPHPVDERAVAAVVEDPSVTVVQTDTGYTVRVAGDGTDNANGSDATAGLILYPGGLVPKRAYLPLAAEVAAASGLTVFLVDVPLHLAVLDADAAGAVVEAHPEVDRWYVGGHSLGGAMACRFAGEAADRVEGVVLLGAYCDVDLRDTDLDALTVVGTRDAVVNREALAAARDRLPADARFVAVEGMNHTQFGVYGGQVDDRGTVSDEKARRQVAEAIASWTAERGERSVDWGLGVDARPTYGDAERVRAGDDSLRRTTAARTTSPSEAAPEGWPSEHESLDQSA